jgi:hypothetical protein
VQAITSWPLPKAAILGKHAWYTAPPRGQRKCLYDRTCEDRVGDFGDDVEDFAIKLIAAIVLSLLLNNLTRIGQEALL